MSKNLSIPQKFVLISLDRETSKLKSMIRIHTPLQTVIACIFELSLRGNIIFDERDTIHVVKPSPTGEKYLDRLLEILIAAKPQKLKDWVSHFYYNQKEIYNIVIENLIELGILGVENKRIMLVAKVKKYEDITNVRETVVEKFRTVLLQREDIDEHTQALVSLLYIKGMLHDYFSRHEHADIKSKLKLLRETSIYKRIKTFDYNIQKMDAAF